MKYPWDCSASGMFARHCLPSGQAILRNLNFKFMKRLDVCENRLIRAVNESDSRWRSNIRKHWLKSLYTNISFLEWGPFDFLPMVWLFLGPFGLSSNFLCPHDFLFGIFLSTIFGLLTILYFENISGCFCLLFSVLHQMYDCEYGCALCMWYLNVL